MKEQMAVMAAVLAFGSGAALAAEAQQCPVLMEQLAERVAKLPDHSFKKDIGKSMIAAAQKLHDEGKDAECVRMVEEAAAVTFAH